jgi:uncharacterized membrane protein
MKNGIMKKIISTIKVGAFIGMPVILTVLTVIWLIAKIKYVLLQSSIVLSKEQLETHQYLYLIILLAIILICYVVGLIIGVKGDEKLDKVAAKIPVIAWIYSTFNQLFKVGGKGGLKGIPILLPIYSDHATVTCLLVSMDKRWGWNEMLQQECWCYTVVPLPNGQPIGGHNQNWPCDDIDRRLSLQHGDMSMDEHIKYCITMGTVFPDRLTQKGDEEMPAYVAEKLKLQK